MQATERSLARCARTRPSSSCGGRTPPPCADAAKRWPIRQRAAEHPGCGGPGGTRADDGRPAAGGSGLPGRRLAGAGDRGARAGSARPRAIAAADRPLSATPTRRPKCGTRPSGHCSRSSASRPAVTRPSSILFQRAKGFFQGDLPARWTTTTRSTCGSGTSSRRPVSRTAIRSREAGLMLAARLARDLYQSGPEQRRLSAGCTW